MVRFFLKPLSVRQMRLLCASLLAGFALCGALQGLCWGRTQLDAGAALCADTLRLHIRAASDAVADQSAKLRVRDAVLAVMQQCPAQSAPEARAWAAGRLLQFQLAAQRALAAQSIHAPVRVCAIPGAVQLCAGRLRSACRKRPCLRAVHPAVPAGGLGAPADRSAADRAAGGVTLPPAGA